MWDLAELASENVQVRETVIDRWFKTGKAVLRGLNNDARGLRAASGLSVALRKRIMLRSKELADRLVTALENPQQTDSFRLAPSARQWQRWRPGWTRRRRRALPTVVVDGRWKIPSRPLASRLVTSSAAQCVRAGGQDGAAGGARALHDRVVTALENPQQTDSSRLADLSGAVAALAARMEPQEAARIATRSAQCGDGAGKSPADR